MQNPLRNPYYEIPKHFMKFLFVDLPCPRCGKQIAVALNTLYKKSPFQCTECKKRSFVVLEDNKLLDLFVQSFGQFHEQLQSLNLKLMFLPQPTATIWKRDDKP